MDYVLKLKNSVLLLGAAVLAGCGSGESGSGAGGGSMSSVDYNGKTTAAVIDENNKETLASNSIKSVLNQIENAEQPDISLPMSVSSSDIDVPDALRGFITNIRSQDTSENIFVGTKGKRLQMSSGEDIGDCGGSVSYRGDETSWSASFSNYCMSEYDYDSYESYEITINGGLRGSSSGRTYIYIYDNLAFTMKFSNETITGSTSGYLETTYHTADSIADYTEKYNITTTYNGETVTMAGEETCTGYINCTYTDYFVDGDDVYQVEVIDDFYESYDGSYSGAMKLYDPEYGYTTVTVSGLVPCESEAGFSAGVVSIEDDSGNALTVTYNGCSQDVTLTLNGVAETASLQ